MTILNARAKLHEKWMELTKDGTDEEMMQALSIADTILGNYDETLKADMVAMLRFLWNDIENLDAPICDYASSDCISKWQIHEVIQQKINELKGDKNEV